MSVCVTLHQATSPADTGSESGSYETGTLSSVDSFLGSDHDDADSRIKQRLEASRQGMLQLEALRNKHQKLMEEVRIRWPYSYDETAKSFSSKNSDVSMIPHNEVKMNEFRSDSPASCCVSHRSSVSMDSGCASLSSDPSVQPVMTYSTYRKLSTEEQRKKEEQNPSAPVVDENLRIVATALESTTAVRCQPPKRYMQNWNRPKSMCSPGYSDENSVVIDPISFSQITPPPIHRKFTTIGRTDVVQPRRPCLAANCFDIKPPTVFKEFSGVVPGRYVASQTAEQHTVLALSKTNQTCSPPYLRLRNPQKPVRTTEQMIFHASRVFVDRSPRNVQKLISQKSLDRLDSDEDSSPRPYRAQPAVVLSRQHSCAHSNENSPTESRKIQISDANNKPSNTVFVSQNHHFTRCEANQCIESTSSERPRRRIKEKDWKESEEL